MKEALIYGFIVQNEEDGQTTALQSSKVSVESCAVSQKGYVVVHGSIGPGFWPSSVPCNPGDFYHDAETTDYFHMTKISKYTLTEPRNSKFPNNILLPGQFCLSFHLGF